MKRTTIFATMLVLSALATATTWGDVITIHPDVNAGGQLDDPGRTGTATAVTVGGAEVKVGNSFGGNWVKLVAEFLLPTTDPGQTVQVNSASIRLWGNGNPAYYGSRINVDVYGYDGTQANGTIEVDDDHQGINLGRILTDTTNLESYNYSGQTPGYVAYVELDVSSFVQDAINGSTNGYAGFRVQSADPLPDSNSNDFVETWRIRGTGFSGYPQYAPALTIDYTVIPEPGTLAGILAMLGLVIARRPRTCR